jgi:hypothetical protein
VKYFVANYPNCVANMAAEEASMNYLHLALGIMLLIAIAAIGFFKDNSVRGRVVTNEAAPSGEVQSLGISSYDRAVIDLSRRIQDPAYALEKPYFESALQQLYRLGYAAQQEKMDIDQIEGAIPVLDRMMRDGFFSDEDAKAWAMHVSSLLAARD